MDSNINDCYKRSFYGGRSKVVRIIDSILIAALIFLAYYAIIKPRIRYGTAAFLLVLTLTAVTLIAYKIVNALRLSRHINGLRNAMRTMLENQALMLLPSIEYENRIRSALNRSCYIIQKTEKLDCDDIYSAARYAKHNGCDKLSIVALSEPTREAVEAAKRLCETDISFENAREIVYNSPNAPVISEIDIDRAIVLRYGKAQRTKLSSRFKQDSALSRTKQYFIVGALLFALSFIMKHSIFVRLIASIALTLSAVMKFTGRGGDSPPPERG